MILETFEKCVQEDPLEIGHIEGTLHFQESINKLVVEKQELN